MKDNLNNLWIKVLEKTTNSLQGNGIYQNFINFTALEKIEDGIAYVISYNKISVAIFNSDESVRRHLEDAFFEILNERITIQLQNVKKEIENKYVPKIKSDLNKNLTFDQFVTGKSNQLAYNILFHTVDNLGENNPIFIYGEPGLGKTHLLSSVGNAVLKNHPTSKVLYLSATNFSNRVSDANSNKTLSEFKQYFFDLDLLLIDDIQTFKSTHELAQNIFFEIFNELVANKKQIIITSDTTQDKLKNILHGRLTSRFKSGITLTIKHPEIETAKKIVIKKIENSKNTPPFTPEVIDYIANNYNNDIRGLEGAINTILLFAIYNPSISDTITLDMTLEALNASEETIEITELTPDTIKKYIASKYHITQKQIESNTRTKNILYPRQIAIYLTRKLLNYSYEAIAQLYNKKDHTTIVNSVKKIKNDMKKNADLQIAIENFIKELSTTK